MDDAASKATELGGHADTAVRRARRRDEEAVLADPEGAVLSITQPPDSKLALVAEGSIEIRDLHQNEVSDAIGVLARGMRDNPLHVAAYGEDPQRRLRCHARLDGRLLPDV